MFKKAIVDIHCWSLPRVLGTSSMWGNRTEKNQWLDHSCGYHLLNSIRLSTSNVSSTKQLLSIMRTVQRTELYVFVVGIHRFMDTLENEIFFSRMFHYCVANHHISPLNENNHKFVVVLPRQKKNINFALKYHEFRCQWTRIDSRESKNRNEKFPN